MLAAPAPHQSAPAEELPAKARTPQSKTQSQSAPTTPTATRLYYQSLFVRLGSPNVPPGSAGGIVQIEIANAAFQAVPAIAAKQADSQKTKKRKVVLSIPFPDKNGQPHCASR